MTAPPARTTIVQCAWCGRFFNAEDPEERKAHWHIRLNGHHLVQKHLEAIQNAAIELNSDTLREAYQILSHGETTP